MKARILLILLGAACPALQAQLRDSMPALGLGRHSPWYGELDYFEEEANGLRLHDPGFRSEGEAWLGYYAPTAGTGLRRWRFHLRLGFSPSPANRVRLYLLGDHPSPGRTGQGYYLQFGGVAGTGDALSLHRMEGTREEPVLEGPAGRMGGPAPEVWVELIQDTDGRWELWSRYRPDAPLELEARTLLPAPILDGSYLALQCVFTASRSGQVYFDSLAYGPARHATDPPGGQGLFPLAADRMVLLFDRPVGRPRPGATLFLMEGKPELRQALRSPADPRRLFLDWQSELQHGAAYTLVLDQVPDHAGHPFGMHIPFTHLHPEPADGESLRINEILFDPEPGGSDYLELFNAADHPLLLDGVLLTNGRGRQAALPAYLPSMPPGAYWVFCADPGWLCARYDSVRPDHVWRVELPSLPKEEGTLLLSRRGLLLDALDYRADLHAPWLKQRQGVALERVLARSDPQHPDTWQSAASTAGYGTPTRKNSQALAPAEPDDALALQLPHRVFSPDGDGWQDLLLIQANIRPRGGVLSLRIFDEQGRPVRQLERHALAGQSGLWSWDGTDGTGQRARMGIYFIVLELLHPDGRLQQARTYCVLAGRKG